MNVLIQFLIIFTNCALVESSRLRPGPNVCVSVPPLLSIERSMPRRSTSRPNNPVKFGLDEMRKRNAWFMQIMEKKPPEIRNPPYTLECCEGYRLDPKNDSRCVPICSKPCQNGYCYSPEECACNAGWYGRACERPCPPGRWGRDCAYACDCLFGTCSRFNGSCTCRLGWQGERCDLACREGYYGFNCSKKCNCQNRPCHPVTGICLLRILETPHRVSDEEKSHQPKLEEVSTRSTSPVPESTIEGPAKKINFTEKTIELNKEEKMHSSKMENSLSHPGRPLTTQNIPKSTETERGKSSFKFIPESSFSAAPKFPTPVESPRPITTDSKTVSILEVEWGEKEAKSNEIIRNMELEMEEHAADGFLEWILQKIYSKESFPLAISVMGLLYAVGVSTLIVSIFFCMANLRKLRQIKRRRSPKMEDQEEAFGWIWWKKRPSGRSHIKADCYHENSVYFQKRFAEAKPTFTTFKDAFDH